MSGAASLGLVLAGPLMSFSVATFERERASEAIPTRSAVLGLCAACLGYPRGEWGALLSLTVSVRADAPGGVVSDFHTVSGTRRASGAAGPAQFPTRREYLTDAAFLVALGGDPAALEAVRSALQRPVFLPYLGRRSCLPGRPLYLAGEEGAVQACGADELLARTPALVEEQPPGVRYLEDPAGPLVVAAASPLPGARRFGPWRLRVEGL